jgi:hypothetical protein
VNSFKDSTLGFDLGAHLQISRMVGVSMSFAMFFEITGVEG